MICKIGALVFTILTLVGCDGTKDIEEFDSRVKYCHAHGATYKTLTSGFNAVFVYCLKDGRQFNSKIFKGDVK